MNKKRVIQIYFLFLCTSLLLSARLYLIADNSTSATEVLSGQYTRKIEIANRNGFVFDRNGKIVDVLQDGYVTLVDPLEMSNSEIDSVAKMLSESGERSQSYFYDKLVTGKPFLSNTDKIIDNKSFISFPKYQENTSTLNHVLGYRNSQGKGVSGILKAYDEFLTEYSKGVVTASYRSDAVGKRADSSDIVIDDINYTSSDGLYLTIDITLQKIVEEICKQYLDMGAVVIQDTNSGEILACASMPCYDKEKLSEYLDSDRGELLNRSILTFTPGSVFKTVVACAALRDDSFDEQSEFECKGYIELCGQKIKCHNLQGHGNVNLKEAFAASCNPYFIDLGCKIGYNKILETANLLGVGRFNSLNLLPCSEAVFPSKSDLGTVANLSVGQGEILLSPLQVCSMISVATTGEYVKPTIAKRTVSNGFSTDYTPVYKEKILEKDVVETMRSLFLSCVEEGTGYRAKSDVVISAGKTATAQSGQSNNGKEVVHSWFAGFFPYDSPKYTVCVFCDGNSEKNEHPSLIFKYIAEEITKLES